MISKTRKHRNSKVCARCRKRKIRCDLRYPVCGSCSTAGEACLGFDSINDVEKARSTVSHLEQEVARLEAQLANTRTYSNSISDIASAAGGTLFMNLAQAVLAPETFVRKQEDNLTLNSAYFLNGSPVPYLSSRAWDDNQGEQSQKHLSKTHTLSSTPRNVVDIMLKHYCQIYRPQYPAIEESALYEACERVYDDKQPSDFDIFSVNITLAISTNTLMHRDEKRATVATRGFWATAAAHLSGVGLASSWERLQALQLLTHYAFLNPQDVNCNRCAAAATRLCFRLGLHRELPTFEQMKLDTPTLNIRKTLLWNTYSIDSAVHTGRCQPFIWPVSAVTAKLPGFDDSHTSTTAHIWILRQIESEITLYMYHPSSIIEHAFLDPVFQQWFPRTKQRLNDWYQMTRQDVNLGEKIEFHELHFQLQRLRLNKTSPRCPSPTVEMQKEALKASVSLIKEYSLIDRLGKLFYLWHAANVLVESGISLLASILTGIEFRNQTSTHLAGEDVATLEKYIRILPSLLWKISRRWPNIEQHATTLDDLSSLTLAKLKHWSNGNSIESSDLYLLKRRLREISEFSLFPLEEQHLVVATDEIGSSGMMSGLEIQHSVASVRPDNSSWPDTLPETDISSLAFPDHIEFGGMDELWFCSGLNSEEIFTALLDGTA